MKFPDFAKSPEILALKRSLGLSSDAEGEFGSPDRALPTLKKALEGPGYDGSLDELTVLEDGSLGLKDVRVTLYIRDWRGPENTYPRFHITRCSVLANMWNNNRAERFLIFSKMENDFPVRHGNSRVRNTALNVCRNCLDHLSYEGFSLQMPEKQKQTAVSNFRLAHFFSKYSKSFPLDTTRFCFETAPPDVYSDNWSKISRQVRAERGWRCEEPNCWINFSDHNLEQYRRFLHVHHISGKISDNSARNLRCLCLYCHAGQLFHAHLKRTPEYRQFVEIRQQLRVK